MESGHSATWETKSEITSWFISSLIVNCVSCEQAGLFGNRWLYRYIVAGYLGIRVSVNTGLDSPPEGGPGLRV